MMGPPIIRSHTLQPMQSSNFNKILMFHYFELTCPRCGRYFHKSIVKDVGEPIDAQYVSCPACGQVYWMSYDTDKDKENKMVNRALKSSNIVEEFFV